MKHLLSLLTTTPQEISELLNLADQLKYENKHGISHKRLSGQTLGMIFQKSSTRTRVSFETGMYQLGGQALFLSNRDLQIGRGEPIEDTARVLSRYIDGIMIRTFAQSEVEALAKYGTIPIINGLTDFCHPCQVLADLMTIREHKGHLDGLKMCYIGDGNNMANSLIVGGLKTGMRVTRLCKGISGLLARARPDAGRRRRRRDFHRRLGFNGSGRRSGRAPQGVRGRLPGQQEVVGCGKQRVHGAALPTGAPRRRNYRRCV